MSSPDSERFDIFLRIEPLLLFLVFYLPGYLAQSQHLSGRIFNDINFNLTYLLTALPRIALLIYVVSLRAGFGRETPPPTGALARYGLVKLRMSDLAWALVALVAIELVIIPLAVFGGELFKIRTGHEPIPIHWRLTNGAIVPLVFLTCMTAGYGEELFFRSYMLTRLEELGLKRSVAVAASSVLFAGGHLYEGPLGAAGTLLIGIVLALFFFRKRNLHVIAIAHGSYNFVTLLATLPLASLHR